MIITNYLNFEVGESSIKIRVPNADEGQPLVDFFRSYRSRIRALGKDADELDLMPTQEEQRQAKAAILPFVEDRTNVPAGSIAESLICCRLAVDLAGELFSLPELKKK